MILLYDYSADYMYMCGRVFLCVVQSCAIEFDVAIISSGSCECEGVMRGEARCAVYGYRRMRGIKFTNPARVPKDYCPLLRGRHAVSSNGRGPEENESWSIQRKTYTYQREVSFHGAEEALTILSGTDDGRLPFVRAS